VDRNGAMIVLINEKFVPVFADDGSITVYQSRIRVEVSGQIFEAMKLMSAEEYDKTYPALREFIHGTAMRNDIMAEIRKKLFEGVV